jgi:DNA repair exonuclease SbcCD ATPase subunit
MQNPQIDNQLSIINYQLKIQGVSFMSEDRLERLERIVETGFSDIFQSLKFLKERQERMQGQQESLQRQQESSQRQIDNLAESQRQVLEAQRSMIESIERLANVQVDTLERIASLAERLDSIGAAVERLDAIIDYLIRRDSEQ